MEGMESAAQVTPDTSSAADGSDSTQDTQATGEQGQQGQESGKTVSQQLKELADTDMDAIVTLKVNGQTKKMSVREAVKYAQLGDSAYQKMQEAASVKKQATELMNFAKQNPKAFFKQLGMDPYDFAEATLAEKLEMMAMSPEQRKLMEYEQRLKSYEEKDKEAKAREEQEKATQAERQVAESLDKELTEAFKASGLPKHPHYVQQIAAIMLSAEKQGVNLSAAEAADKVKSRFKSHTRELLETLDAQAIQELLGDGILKRLRKQDLERVTAGAAPTARSGSRPDVQSSVTDKKTPQEPMSEKEWRLWVQKHKS